MTLNRAGRRSALGKGLAVTTMAALTACSASSATSTPTATATQVLLDIQGGIGTLKVIVAQAGQYLSPTVLAAVTVALNQAANAFAALSSALADINTASTLQTVEGYLAAAASAVVAALGGVSGASTWLVAAETVQALLPAITTWINSILAPVASATPQARENLNPRNFVPIRSKLGIPTLLAA